MSGATLVTHLRTIHPNTQALFISGYPRTHFDDIPSERDGFLEKPFRGDELVSRARALFNDTDDFSAA
jgi:DNA-binding response OmpR family regulator